VALARALITQPAILLADEPTGNLDTKSGTAIMELLQRSCRELEQTVIVVTHDPRAAAYAQRVIFLRDGLVVREFPISETTLLAERMSAILAVMRELEAE